MTETLPVSPSTLQKWIIAARPRTLPASLAPVIVGAALAAADQSFKPGPALAAALIALLLQIGANFANDVFDFQKGADTSERLGPVRVTLSGLLTQKQVLIGMWITFGLAGLLGIYLAVQAGWILILVGALAILSAIAYTGGPYPLGYNGLGEVFVFIFFGLVAVNGTYYVQAGQLTPASLWASAAVGLLTVNILVVNNLRDIATDRASGKRTLAVRFGEMWTRREYAVLLAAAYLIPLLMALTGLASAWVLLTLASVPRSVRLVRDIYSLQGRPLNKALAGTGSFELLFSLLFAAGLLIPVFIA